MTFHHYRWLLLLTAAGASSWACTERNDVARDRNQTSGAGGDSAAGLSNGASSDRDAGGSAGRGVGTGPGGGGDAGVGGVAAGGDAGDSNLGDAATILVAGVALGPEAVLGTSYQNGSWAPVKVIQNSGTPVQGAVGVALLPDGTGIAAMRGELGFHSASWNGNWTTSAHVPGPNALVPALGRMSSFPGGALVAHWSGPDFAVELDTYDPASRSWRLAEGTMGDGAYFAPAVASLGSGDPLVVYYGPEHRYYCTRRYGGAWMHHGAVPLTLGTDSFNFNAQIDLVKRTGVDQVVAVFSTDIGKLTAVVFENDRWSSPKPIASDASVAGSETRHTHLAELADGRVALAYWTNLQGIKIGFFDGSNWSDFRAVPDAFANGYSPIAISRGAPGAVLELLYNQRPGSPPEPSAPLLRHARLTDDKTWSWTAPKVIDAAHIWATIAIAAAP